MNIKKSIGLSTILLASVIAHAGVSGTVFQDLPLSGNTINSYGIQDGTESGIEGITVTADSGESTTTTSNGSWTLPTTNSKVRIEFTNIPAHLKESAGQSSVQFIDNGASDINLGLFNPAEYTVGTSDIAMTFQPSASLTTNDTPVALKILLNADIPETETNTIATTTGDIPFNQIGTVWGLAYDSSNQALYASASLRRYSAVGSMGTGGIYKININDSSVEEFVTVSNTTSNTYTINRNLSQDPNDPSHDPIFNEVGRMGLGDIDISQDGKKLYTININTNQLIEIDIESESQTEYPIGNPFGAGCPAADVTSWGIGQNSGKVYVGSVCTTNTTQGAYISELNGDTFTPFHQIPLDMDGEHSLDTIYVNESMTLDNNKRWGKWITEVNDLFNTFGTRASLAAPILSDIIFDENKGMILGFTDRTSLQSGIENYSPSTDDNKTYKYDAAGDIYRVCKTSSGYYNEGTTECPQHDTTATAPSYPEFFIDEEWNLNEIRRHKETALGGLAYEQGSNNILSSAFDPVNIAGTYNTSGIVWMDRDSGQKTAGQIMVGDADDRTYNGKAGGIGDIEFLTPPAPTEIGNRVWFDENKNCIQDANESGIEGVVVSLYQASTCTGTAEGTVTTDVNGNYLFPVTAGKEYSVCINNIANQTVLIDKNLTALTTCIDTESALNNNDATTAGNDAKIAVSALTTGANDHSFDFGFVQSSAVIVTPPPVVTPPVIVVPEQNNTVDEHTNGSCDCHSYKEDSSPALNLWSMMLLISLTSFMAFLFRKELN